MQLSAKEYELLVALAEDPEWVFKKEELLRNMAPVMLSCSGVQHRHTRTALSQDFQVL